MYERPTPDDDDGSVPRSHIVIILLRANIPDPPHKSHISYRVVAGPGLGLVWQERAQIPHFPHFSGS